MKVIKGFKLANALLAAALTLALTGCIDDSIDSGSSSSSLASDSGSDSDSDSGSDSDSDSDSDSGSEDFSADEFILFSSTGEWELDLGSATVGEWSTGSNIDLESTYEGLSAWTITSGTTSAEAGNWGTVVAFDGGIDGDFSLYTKLKIKIATSGGYNGGYFVWLSANGVGQAIALPVNDSITTWQEVEIDLADVALNLSEIDGVAVYGIGGNLGSSQIHITDFSLVQDEAITVDTETESDFVFKSSDSSVSSNLDDDPARFGEWSTGTNTTDTTYDELDAWVLATSSSWGSVLALESDSQYGTYETDFSLYTNLKLKVASEGNFSGYEVYIEAKNGDYSAGNKVGFSLSEQAEWNEIDIDLDSFGADLSNVSQIVVYGIYSDGTASSQKLYVTDYIAYDSGISTVVDKDSSDDKFVFISSTDEDIDIVVDGDSTVHEGNITVGEWSTSTTISTTDVKYDNVAAWKLTQTSGWGAVLAMMGDTYGSVQSYDIDLSEYSTLNFSIAEDNNFSETYLDILTTTGAECKIALSVGSDWSDVSINLDELPVNLDQINQIVIYGVGAAGYSLYVTDFNIAK